MSKRVSQKLLRHISRDIDPDEVFLDSKNLPGFDRDQFEGRIEKPISQIALLGVFISFVLVAFVFLIKITSLQITHGAEFLEKSENNRLDHKPIFAMRGVIYDRNNIALAWNSFDEVSNTTSTTTIASTSTKNFSFPNRSYIKSPGFGHVLGYVSYPKKDNRGIYYQESFIGKDGIEEYYNDMLSGVNGVQIVETNARGKVEEGSIVEAPQNGRALTLSLDARVEEKLHTTIRDTADNFGYMAGAGAIMDIENGELLAMTSYPEYESGELSLGKNRSLIQSYSKDKRAVFLDRAVSGVYTPGSIVKPFMAIAALNEGVINPEKQILSTGSISIQNPYYPDIKSVFNDWKAHGWVDMRKALAVSSDVYFYEIGGGFEGQRGIGIANIEKYARMFGFGAPTGVDITDEKSGTIPSPEWKAKMFKGEDWRLGDTYHTVIGQYGFQTTVLQAVRGIASVANGGTLVAPHFLINSEQEFPKTKIEISPDYFQIAREGMRQAVKIGTVSGLDVPYVTVAGKTGTAEIDAAKKYINSWIVGFFPYENPKYAFAVVMERGPHEGTIGGVYVMRQVLDWMSQNTPEYFNLNAKDLIEGGTKAIN